MRLTNDDGSVKNTYKLFLVIVCIYSGYFMASRGENSFFEVVFSGIFCTFVVHIIVYKLCVKFGSEPPEENTTKKEISERD